MPYNVGVKKKPVPKVPKKAQRGKKTPERIAAILKEIESSSSMPIWKACKLHDLSLVSWESWLSKDEELANRYVRAKEKQLQRMADEILQISDDSIWDELFVEEDTKEGKSAKRVLNHEFVQRSKLRVDSRKWLLSKLLPKKYGDKIDVEHSASESLMALVAARLAGGG